MLENLEIVPWHKIAHAYGDASNVPEAIRALANNDQDKDEPAWEVLWNHLLHQGSVFEATAHAIPFLVELLEIPTCNSRADILNYLAHVARGNSYLEVHQGLMDENYKASEEFIEQLAEEQSWLKNISEAVAAGVPVYLKLLTDNDVNLRIHATHMLGVCKNQANEIVHSLQAHLPLETDDTARASLVFCLATLAGNQEESFLQQLLETESSLVKLVAAMSLCYIAEKVPEQAIQILVEAMAQPENVALYSELPWTEFSEYYASNSTETLKALYAELPKAHQVIKRDVSQALSIIDNIDFAIPLLLENFLQLKDFNVLGIVESLLYLSFNKPFVPDPVYYLHSPEAQETEIQLENLTPVQNEVLTAIATHEAASKINGILNITLLLDSCGLADGINRFRKNFLGLEPVSDKLKSGLQNVFRFPERGEIGYEV